MPKDLSMCIEEIQCLMPEITNAVAAFSDAASSMTSTTIGVLLTAPTSR